MSLYAIKNDKGEWLGWEVYQDDPKFICGGGSVWTDLDKAKFYAKANGGHVVELAEAPAKIMVNEDEAEMLEQAKCDEDPAELLVGFVNSRYKYDEDGDAEDRLMRAYVNGYTVAKEKKYYVKVPLVQAQGGLWFYINSDDKLDATDIQGLAKKFTIDEIEHYGLQDCEKAEVEQDAE